MSEALSWAALMTLDVPLAKGLGILFGMLVLVALLVGGATLWMGPGLAHLAFLDPNRGSTYTLLDFVRLEPIDALEARYHRPLTGLLASEGAQLKARYNQTYLLEGRRADEWQQMSLVHLPRAQDLAQIMTSAPYRLLRRGVSRIETLKVGSYQETSERWRNSLVVWRVVATSDPFTRLRERVAETDGRIVWDGGVEVIEGDARWNRTLVVDFAEAREALTWLRSRPMETERAVLNSHVHDLSLAVYARQEMR